MASSSTRRWVLAGLFATAMVAVIPFPARGANPWTNTSCWQKEICEGDRYRSFDTKFEEDDDHCGSGWGRCFARKKIDIAIHIPWLAEEKKVSDLGEYLRVVYVFLVRFAAILAVIVLMVAGIAWMTSADSGRLQQAKQWMGNAIIGLLLTVGSYVLLQTINPDLVVLRMPRPYFLRPIAMGAQFCSEVARRVEQASGQVAMFGQQEGGSYTLSYEQQGTITCGVPYYPDPAQSAGRTCFGTTCPQSTVCVPKGTEGFECARGILGGKIDFADEMFVDDVRLVVLCRDGNIEQVDAVDLPEGVGKSGVQSFAISGGGTDRVTSTCGGAANQRGLFLRIEVNVPSELLAVISGAIEGALRGTAGGVVGSVGGAVAGGAGRSSGDVWFAVGKSSCSGSSRPFTGVDASGAQTTDPDRFTTAVWQAIPTNALWTVQELFPVPGGTPQGNVNPCNLGVNAATFTP